MKNRIKIFVDGKSFTLVGEETELHMKAVAAHIDDKIGQIRNNAVAVKMDTSLAYVLAALNVADDYFKEKEKNAELEGRNLGLSTRLEQLIPQLDETKAELELVKAQLEDLKGKFPQPQAVKVEKVDTENQLLSQNNEEQTEKNDEHDLSNISEGLHPHHYPMGLKGGQAEKNMVKRAIREKYRKK